MLTMVLKALFSSKNDCSALGSAARAGRQIRRRRRRLPPRHGAANFGQTGIERFGLRGHIGGQVALHQGGKLVLHRIHFLMACEAMLHPLHGKKSELVLGAQCGHERGTFADARIVHDGDLARIDLAVHGELERIDAGNHLRPMRTGSGGALHHVHLILEVVPQGGRVVILQVPVDAVETDVRRERRESRERPASSGDTPRPRWAAAGCWTWCGPDCPCESKTWSWMGPLGSWLR